MCNCFEKLFDNDTLTVIILILAILLVCDSCSNSRNNDCC